MRDPGKARIWPHWALSWCQGAWQTRPHCISCAPTVAAVIHGAGAVRGSSQAEFDRVNVSGTAAIIDAVQAQATPPLLLLLSSLAASEPQLSWYAHSKRAGEQQLEQEPDSTG